MDILCYKISILINWINMYLLITLQIITDYHVLLKEGNRILM
jgi:hypothetical protein